MSEFCKFGIPAFCLYFYRLPFKQRTFADPDSLKIGWRAVSYTPSDERMAPRGGMKSSDKKQ